MLEVELSASKISLVFTPIIGPSVIVDQVWKTICAVWLVTV